MAQSATDRTRRLDLIFLSMSGPQAHQTHNRMSVRP